MLYRIIVCEAFAGTYINEILFDICIIEISETREETTSIAFLYVQRVHYLCTDCFTDVCDYYFSRSLYTFLLNRREQS